MTRVLTLREMAGVITLPTGRSHTLVVPTLLRRLDDDVRFRVERGARNPIYVVFAPDFAARLSAVFRDLNAREIVPVVTAGYRTAAIQRNMRRGGSGRNPAAAVSLHQAGWAVDISGTTTPAFREVRSAFRRGGMVWGGAWSRPDPPHFEANPFGDKGEPAYARRIAEAARAAEVYFNGAGITPG